ncbi:hypothetical protein [Arcobacter sp.]|uniref:hypothetical protein n=1 Tax=Arcobacter sp. TaxID=1872629 RepID=UPI003D09C2AD
MDDIRYIFDSNNRKTHKIVPIEYRSFWDTDGREDYDFMNQKPCWLKHYTYLCDLLSKLRFIDTMLKNDTTFNVTINDWNIIFENFFKYYNTLDAKDIQILYFFRSEAFFNSSGTIQDHVEYLAKRYNIKNIYGNRFNENDFGRIGRNLNYMSEFEFLQFFNTNYTIDLPIENKRLQRLTDRNRMFVYDLFTVNELYKDKEELSRFREITYSKKDIVELIAKGLYKSNNTQVYRAYQEATEKIYTYL